MIVAARKLPNTLAIAILFVSTIAAAAPLAQLPPLGSQPGSAPDAWVAPDESQWAAYAWDWEAPAGDVRVPAWHTMMDLMAAGPVEMESLCVWRDASLAKHAPESDGGLFLALDGLARKALFLLADAGQVPLGLDVPVSCPGTDVRPCTAPALAEGLAVIRSMVLCYSDPEGTGIGSALSDVESALSDAGLAAPQASATCPTLPPSLGFDAELPCPDDGVPVDCSPASECLPDLCSVNFASGQASAQAEETCLPVECSPATECLPVDCSPASECLPVDCSPASECVPDPCSLVSPQTRAETDCLPDCSPASECLPVECSPVTECLPVDCSPATECVPDPCSLIAPATRAETDCIPEVCEGQAVAACVTELVCELVPDCAPCSPVQECVPCYPNDCVPTVTPCPNPYIGVMIEGTDSDLCLDHPCPNTADCVPPICEGSIQTRAANDCVPYLCDAATGNPQCDVDPCGILIAPEAAAADTGDDIVVDGPCGPIVVPGYCRFISGVPGICGEDPMPPCPRGEIGINGQCHSVGLCPPQSVGVNLDDNGPCIAFETCPPPQRGVIVAGVDGCVDDIVPQPCRDGFGAEPNCVTVEVCRSGGRVGVIINGQDLCSAVDLDGAIEAIRDQVPPVPVEEVEDALDTVEGQAADGQNCAIGATKVDLPDEDPCAYVPAPPGTYYPESVQGTTPFSGGPLKPAYNCAYAQGYSVNIVTGEFLGRTCAYTSNAHFGELFELVLTHRSQAPTGSALGQRWSHNYDQSIVTLSGDRALLHDGSGRTHEFACTRSGSDWVCEPPVGVFKTLRLDVSDGEWTLANPHGYKDVFDAASGRLKKSVQPSGATFNFAYTGGQLSTVTDAQGRVYTFTYTSGRLTGLTSFDGRQVSFVHDANGRLSEIRTPGDGVSPTFASKFVYDGAGRLTSAKDNKGQTYLENDYDSFGRVEEQTYAGGTFGFAYNLNAQQTTVTDPNGNRRIYTHGGGENPVPSQVDVEANRGIAGLVTDSFTTYFLHDEDQRRIGTVQPKGNLALTVYDVQNADRLQQDNILATILAAPDIPDPVSGKFPAPMVTLMTYETRYNQVKTVVEPRGTNPTHVPDNLGPTSPDRYKTTYWYDYEEASGSVADINSDGTQSQNMGNLIKIDAPIANPFGVPNTNMLAASANQAASTKIAYYNNGQMRYVIDPENHKQEFTYFASNGIAGDASDREGFLKTHTVDAGTGTDPRTGAAKLNLVTSYDYDVNGNLVQLTDPAGIFSTVDFDQRNRVAKKTAPAPFLYQTSYQYDANDNLVATIVPGDAGSFTHTQEYDQGDRVVESVWDASRPTSVTSGEPTTLPMDYRYDPNGNLVLVRNPKAVLGFDANDVTSYMYDELNRVHTVTRGAITSQFADLQAHDQVLVDLAKDGNDALKVVPFPPGVNRPVIPKLTPFETATTLFQYDANGNPTVAVGPRGFATINEYDGFDRLAIIRDALGNEQEFSRDANGFVKESVMRGPLNVDPESAAQSAALTAGNVVLSRSRVKMDELGRVYESSVLFNDPTTGLPQPGEGMLTPGDGFVSQIVEYDRAARVVRTLNDNVHQSLTYQDGANRVVKVIGPNGDEARMTYNKVGNVLSATAIQKPTSGSARSFTNTFVYDELGRLQTGTDPLGNVEAFEYDNRGRVSKATDARGNVETYTYDGAGRLWKTDREVRAGGLGSGALLDVITTRTEWDANSRPAKRIDDNGNPTRVEYTTRGLISRTTMADGSQYLYDYDAAANLVRLRDPNGNDVSFTYDPINRRVGNVAVPGTGILGTTQQTFQYNGLGLPTLVTDDNDPADQLDDSLLTASYDSLGNVIRGSMNGLPIERTFDGVGNLQTFTYYNGRTVTFDYDTAERLTTVADLLDGPSQVKSLTGQNPPTGAPKPLASYTYDGGNRLATMKYGNGISVGFTFDAAARLTQRTDGSISSPLTAVAYKYDQASNVLSRKALHDTDDGQVFQYDSLNRLSQLGRGTLDASATSVATPAPTGLQSQLWTLDGVNNVLQTTRQTSSGPSVEQRTPNAINEIATRVVDSHSRPLAYDRNGNLVNDGAMKFQYDFQDRVRRVTDLQGNEIATYDYDAYGRRVSKQVGEAKEAYLYASGNLVEIRDGTTGLTKVQVIRGTGGPVALDIDTNGNGVPGDPQDTRLFYHLDAQGSVLGMSNTAGVLVEGYTYDAYGQRTVYKPGVNGKVNFGGDDQVLVGGVSAVGNPLGYVGQFHDAETGLDYLNARYYNAAMGIFLTRDPIGIWGDPKSLGNGYSYAGANPSTASDPSGLLTSPSAGRMATSSSMSTNMKFGTVAYSSESRSSSGDVLCDTNSVCVPCPTAGSKASAGDVGGCPGDPTARCTGLAIVTIGGCQGADSDDGNGQPGCSGGAIVAVQGGCTGGRGADSVTRKGGDGGYGCDGEVIVAHGSCTGGDGGNGCRGDDGTSTPGYTTRNPDDPRIPGPTVPPKYTEATNGCDGGNGGTGCSGGVAIAISSCTGGTGGMGGRGGDGYDCIENHDSCTGGNGGNGGNGGHGGTGCDTVLSVSQYNGCQGGAGGRGGDGGTGGDSPVACKDDAECKWGRNVAEVAVCGAVGFFTGGPTLVGAITGGACSLAWEWVEEKYDEGWGDRSDQNGSGGRGGRGGNGGTGCNGFNVGGCNGGAAGQGGDGGAHGNQSGQAEDGANGREGNDYGGNGGPVP